MIDVKVFSTIVSHASDVRAEGGLTDNYAGPMKESDQRQDCKIDGHYVPKGSAAIVMLVPLQRDPKYFPDPDKFDSDRWITDNPLEKHPFCYIPFSAGLRNCVGQKFAVIEEKVLLSRMLRKFKITCTEPDGIARSGLLVLRPAKGLRVKLTKRFE